MNRNIKKMLREYEREFTYKKAPDALKQKLNLVPKERFQDHPILWRTVGYVCTAVFCVSVSLPLGYMIADKGLFGTPQTTCDNIASAEAFLKTHFDESVRTPVLTFFSGNQTQVSLYFAIENGQNCCFFVIESKDDVDLKFVNSAIDLNLTKAGPFNFFVIDSDELTSFRMDLLKNATSIQSWDVDFDIPTYLTYI